MLASWMLVGCFTEPPNAVGDDRGSSSGSTSASTSTSTSSGGPGPTTTVGAETTTRTTGPTSSSTVADTGSGTSTTGQVEPSPCDDPSRILYLNLEGSTLAFGASDDARTGETSLGNEAGDWSAYSGSDAQQLVEDVAAHFALYDVCVSADPPDVDGPLFDLAVVTSDVSPAGPTVTNQGDVDCGDAESYSVTVVWLGSNVIAPLPTGSKATIISRAVAEFYGAELVNSAFEELMHSQVDPDSMFKDECFATASNVCPTLACQEGQQNSVARLTAALELFGP